MHISLETINRANSKMIARQGKPRELSPLEKYADRLVGGGADSVELAGIKKEFNSLPQKEQKQLVLFAKLRQKVAELFQSP